MTLSEAQRRRRLIIGVLGMLAGATLLGAFTSSGSARMGLFAVNLVFDAALVGYLLLLGQARQVAAEREMKVRYLPRPLRARSSRTLSASTSTSTPADLIGRSEGVRYPEAPTAGV